jgi:methylated-DNA-[protein]-cysteine S-methyltransferase
MRDYQAVFLLPCSRLGIVVDDEALLALDFLATDVAAKPPVTPLAQQVWEELSAYLNDPAHRFRLPLKPGGTAFQQRVWQQIAAIAPGKTVSYGDIAHALQTSPRPVGTACGANPLPLVVPCHRVVGKTGLGGFNGQKTNLTLDVKRWLLRHEGHRI